MRTCGAARRARIWSRVGRVSERGRRRRGRGVLPKGACRALPHPSRRRRAPPQSAEDAFGRKCIFVIHLSRFVR